jgi:hypothetical protein
LAHEEFKKKLMDGDYLISAFYDDATLMVLFRKDPPPPGSRGNLNEHPALEVVIDLERMEIIQSTFLR